MVSSGCFRVRKSKKREKKEENPETERKHSNCEHMLLVSGYLVLKTSKRRCSKQIVLENMQRSGKEDSTRQRWRQTEGERERETEREEEGEERESVVNGEQRVFQSGFRPLFVLRLPQLWRKNRKKREKKEEKGERDREKEEVLRR